MNLIEQAEEFIYNLLKDNLSELFTYHNFNHTLDVVNAVKELAENENIDQTDSEILQIAAWFHDCGYIHGSTDHEDLSIVMVTNFLKEQEVSEGFIAKVCSLINATKYSNTPKNILEQIIREAIYPKTPEDKINYLLNYLHSLQEYEGSRIDFPKNEKNQELANRLYFKNYKEMAFYLFTLKNKGLINGLDASTRDGSGLAGITLTYEGLSKVIELNENGTHSDRCFVAMSFSTSQNETRVAIKKAITDAGYDPILIDEQHIDSDVTINDALISEIRKSKFVVADFTEHKHGVYFEAGFALGLKRPVIYLCEGNDFKNTHFDTNHYPHIIYNNLGELKEKLTTKIEAWIN